MISLFKRKNDNRNIPEYWKKYLDLFSSNNSYKISIDKAKFVVLDIETTGLNIKKDKIISIGALTVCGNEIDISKSLEVYLKHDKVNHESIAIHGIINNPDRNIDEAEAVKMLIEYSGNSILVGHNINFDIAFINRVLNNNFNGSLKNKYVDTFNLYHRIKKGERITKNQSSLDALCGEYNITASDRHTALGDTYITAVLLLKFIGILKKRGVNTVEELLKNRTKIL